MANDDTINTLKNDTKDALDEAKNRAQAAGESAKRAVAGDAMPLHERVASNVKEALHNTKAEYDSAKRDVRHEPATDPNKV